MTKNMPIAEDGELFASLTLGGKPLSDCECIEIKPNSVHLYILPRGEAGAGFDFAATNFVSCDVRDGPVYENPTLQVERIVHGVAYFDGLRHVYVGEDGYLYYADSVALSRIFDELRKCEDRYCSHLYRGRGT